MRNPLYLRQLKRDLDHWIEEGLIDPDTAQTMWDEAGQGGQKHSLSSSLAILGVILLGFAAMSFVAANFWGIAKIVQLSLLFGAMFLSYAIGWWCLHTKRIWAGQAAILLGVGLFGVNIMMIAQIYHISAHYPNGVMAWALGALLTAILVPSRTALAAAFVLACVWTGLETLNFDVSFHWPFLAFWTTAFITVQVMRWRLGFHLGILSLIYWLTINTGNIADLFDWREGELASLYAVFWLGLWAKSMLAGVWGYAHARSLGRYGVFLFYATFFTLLLIDPTGMGDQGAAWRWSIAGLTCITLIIGLSAWAAKRLITSDIIGFIGALAALIAFPYLNVESDTTFDSVIWVVWFFRGIFLAVTAWLLSHGIRQEDRFIVNVSFIAFGAEILLIYMNTFDTLLNQSAFFAIGGILLIAVAMSLEWLRRRLTSHAHEEATS